MILFRGREQSRPEQGVRLLQRFAEDVSEYGVVEFTPTIDGRNMVMVIGPLKSKADAKAAQLKASKKAAKEKEAVETPPVTKATPEPELPAADVATEEQAAAPVAPKTPAKAKPAAKTTATTPVKKTTTATKPKTATQKEETDA